MRMELPVFHDFRYHWYHPGMRPRVPISRFISATLIAKRTQDEPLPQRLILSLRSVSRLAQRFYVTTLTLSRLASEFAR